MLVNFLYFFFQAEDGIRDKLVTGVQTCALPISPEWVFQDEGYSGASLVRPGLEALRDLAAQGQITAVLIYSPDRLSRKYAYQVLLSEELSRCGVELIFLERWFVRPEHQTRRESEDILWPEGIGQAERAAGC